ncbi:iron complex transport system ATP-binding protein [Alkalispirochaeta americana]|uniref:Iron complex transport system ATP-binding protein n=1 Tax=Alkalispirochaeta americana TaxID=159291 RepID=A0A1N6S4K6_9SPIO|nr:ABC transporter ATP-binding protein [Alkalispirochaeta americana]SIQ36034.1 iron complex transport system ATP-binding protein [Alkalispirochaeta americana]
MILEDLRLGYRRGPDVVTVARAEVLPGEVISLAGPNGGGKTTLLRCLAGLLKPREGMVFLEERPLYGSRSWSREARARRLAVVLTDPVSPAYLRVRDVVALGRLPHCSSLQSPSGRDAAVDQALETTGTLHLAQRSLGHLSDGERQRVMIARALAQEPRILLLDEPAAHLDPPHQTALFLLLRDLVERQVIASAVIATHHLHLALHFSHRLFLLAGTLQGEGTPEELLATGAVERAYPSPGTITLDPQRGWFIPRPSPPGKATPPGKAAPEL